MHVGRAGRRQVWGESVPGKGKAEAWVGRLGRAVCSVQAGRWQVGTPASGRAHHGEGEEGIRVGPEASVPGHQPWERHE